MKVEIENTREIKEVIIGQDGTINSYMPEYAGYIAKIVVINQKGERATTSKTIEKSEKQILTHIDLNKIEGLRHREGLPRSRQTAKAFSKHISDNFEIGKKDLSWILLKNGIQIRYSNSVIYENDEGDFLWFSFSYEDLSEHMKMRDVYLAFIVRESRKLVYVKAEEVIDIFKKAAKLRNNDWLHIHLLFYGDKLKIHVKTGKNNLPLEKELLMKENYLDWKEFVKIVEG